MLILYPATLLKVSIYESSIEDFKGQIILAINRKN